MKVIDFCPLYQVHMELVESLTQSTIGWDNVHLLSAESIPGQIIRNSHADLKRASELPLEASSIPLAVLGLRVRRSKLEEQEAELGCSSMQILWPSRLILLWAE